MIRTEEGFGAVRKQAVWTEVVVVVVVVVVVEVVGGLDEPNGLTVAQFRGRLQVCTWAPWSRCGGSWQPAILSLSWAG